MIDGTDRTPLTRESSDRPVLAETPDLPGRDRVSSPPDDRIGARPTEVEAYAGRTAPASRTYDRGPTRRDIAGWRNSAGYGRPGHGHVSLPDGTAGRAA
ncbi:hypothetical protein [Streptomyces sp. NBC_01013]|uniref:hypothetical protein n=1 Tax=Streptomyces sp. NBC_01013 TaxID=2903718 RepID=UPI003868A955|nr:hypothetical protein OG538_28610 [Streptomyces sp. NBC_01013]